MSKNLEAKIAALLNEIEQLGHHDRVRALAGFVRGETGMMEMTHNWNSKDLALIRSRAIGIMQNLSSTETLEGKTLYQNDENMRTYCFAQATYEYMRSLSMTPYIIGIQRQKSKTIQCEHRNVIPAEKVSSHFCLDCQKFLKPSMWVEVSDSE